MFRSPPRSCAGCALHPARIKAHATTIAAVDARANALIRTVSTARNPIFLLMAGRRICRRRRRRLLLLLLRLLLLRHLLLRHLLLLHLLLLLLLLLRLWRGVGRREAALQALAMFLECARRDGVWHE